QDRATGSFEMRPAVRAELRANVSGFLKEIYYEESDRVSPGYPVARLEVPDLDSRLSQKRAEMREAQAKLRLRDTGRLPEEVTEPGSRVEQMKVWRDVGIPRRNNLTRLTKNQRGVFHCRPQAEVFSLPLLNAHNPKRKTCVKADSSSLQQPKC